MGIMDEVYAALELESVYTLSNSPTDDIYSKIQYHGADLKILSLSTVREPQ